jgi:hypothetical protein
VGPPRRRSECALVGRATEEGMGRGKWVATKYWAETWSSGPIGFFFFSFLISIFFCIPFSNQIFIEDLNFKFQIYLRLGFQHVFGTSLYFYLFTWF